MTMIVRASRLYRYTFAIGLLCGIGMAGMWTYVVMSEGWWAWLMLPMTLYLLLYYGYLSYQAWLRPVVRIDDRVIEWRAVVSPRVESIALRNVVGCRLQDAYDLRLRLDTGDERSIHLSQVDRRDRRALIATLECRGNAA